MVFSPLKGKITSTNFKPLYHIRLKVWATVRIKDMKHLLTIRYRVQAIYTFQFLQKLLV
jgi:hypothetical protein